MRTPWTPHEAPSPRAEIFARAPLESLKSTMQRAIAARDDQTVRDCEEAIAIKAGELRADSGELREIVEQPCRENGWRQGITRYEGDIMAAFGPFMSGGQVFALDDDRVVEARRQQIAAERTLLSDKRG